MCAAGKQCSRQATLEPAPPQIIPGTASMEAVPARIPPCREQPGRQSGSSGEQTQPTHPHHDSHNSIKNNRLRGRGFLSRGNPAPDTSTTMGSLCHCQHSPSQQHDQAGRAVRGSIPGQHMQYLGPPACVGMVTALCPWPPTLGSPGSSSTMWERQQEPPSPSTWGLWDSKASAQSSPCTGKSPKHKIQKKMT